ncbi:hypothetical protein Godav_015910 [Gossypium davidsonii]|uniref:DUF4283 domain-containing protein n=1 Tax=Gossypium davidsonii TaxID=34287 RepID=A0A7J8RQG4_GOSDV|nr:hypothetical protein [Gossypium davidsonii]
MTSATLPTVDFTADANSSGSNSGVGRAMKKVNLVRTSSEKEQNVFMEEDFALTKGDVLTEMVEGVPSITFLDRVQEYIERQMAKIIIVKLLGGEIGFNVLLNKITLLWNPKCPIQLMDLENDFFVVRFQDKNDYNKALIRGLWSGLERMVEKEPFGPWMVVEQRKKRSRVTRKESNDSYGGAFGGSWFSTLGDLRGENLSDVDGKIDDEMEDRN